MSRHPTPLSVAAGVLFVDGKILVGQRPAAGRHPLQWEFPGGKIESGENAPAALVRELREELAVEATAGASLWVTRHHYPQGPSVEITFLQTASIDQEPTNLVFADLRWVPIAVLGDLDLLEGDREFVHALRSGAVAPTPTTITHGLESRVDSGSVDRCPPRSRNRKGSSSIGSV
jgi:8-oxo-dGTP diphosphatase